MFRNRIEKIMRHLSGKEKMVLILSEIEGMNIREIAALMDISSINMHRKDAGNAKKINNVLV